MGDFNSLKNEAAQAFQEKKLRTALGHATEAKKLQEDDNEINRIINSCQFDLNKASEFTRAGNEALENGDVSTAYQNAVELQKLIAQDDMVEDEKELVFHATEKQKARVLMEANSYQAVGDLYRALGVLDGYLAENADDKDIGALADQVRDAIPKQEAKRRKNTIVYSVVIPAVLIIAVFVALGIFRANQERKAQEARLQMIMDYLDGAFVAVPAGEFEMGGEMDIQNELPIHTVTVPSFAIQRTEMIQEVWEAVMEGNNPAFAKGKDRPVEQVSWTDVQEFLLRLNEIDPNQNYRLPTEAEWEYACRAGTQTPYYLGSYVTDLEDIAWFGENPDDVRAYPPGLLTPNQFGLYDMLGNVREWCIDYYHDNYEGAPGDGSAWEDPATDLRVARGGSVYTDSLNTRSASRGGFAPDTKSADLGFRVVRDVTPDEKQTMGQ
ncbi:SUMF1/EgtB/PvdO family nonheme iron enzyme [bacterium]|nr:SUMF1/EgtB/PvdO family nonheme iron enzyme [bacterium]